MKISRGRPTLSAPVPFVFHPMGAASCQPQGFKCIHTGAHLPGARCIRTGSTFTGARRPPARLQVQTCRCPLAGRKMHTHWLHIYRCSQTRLKAYRCPPVRLHVCTWLQVHRCPQTWLRACRCPLARLQVQPCRYPQARLQVQTCRCLPQARLQVCRCQQARLQIYTCCPYGLRVPVYVPPTSDTTQPMG